MPTQDWRAISEAKRATRDALIPPAWRLSSLPGPEVLDVTHVPVECGILSALELEITDTDAGTIVTKIADGTWRSRDVAQAFCKRAAIAQQLVRLSSMHPSTYFKL
jgi:amidase